MDGHPLGVHVWFTARHQPSCLRQEGLTFCDFGVRISPKPGHGSARGMCLAHPIHCKASSTLTYGPNSKWMGIHWGYMYGSLLDISLLVCVRRVSLFAILVCESAPSRATEVPEACVWPTQSIAKRHQPSHMVPIANGWASIGGTCMVHC